MTTETDHNWNGKHSAYEPNLPNPDISPGATTVGAGLVPAQTPPAEPTLPAWERVKLARHPDRPHTLDYIQRLCADFVELHGDRLFGDDAAIIGGLASFEGQTVMVIGQQ